MRRITILAAVAASAAAVIVVSISSSGASGSRPVHHEGGSSGSSSGRLASEIAKARLALAPFATDLGRAKDAGYEMLITRMIPDMGYHYMNPDVKRFDVRRPPILVYVKRRKAAQLVAAEWVFTSKPAKPPLPGARYGSFDAACHYADGTFVFADDQAECEARSPESGAAFTFWHPDLVTLHLWLWYPNPDGVFNGTNALVSPFNRG
jgi:hypothetical protein